jgi:hypothetical protein
MGFDADIKQRKFEATAIERFSARQLPALAKPAKCRSDEYITARLPFATVVEAAPGG